MHILRFYFMGHKYNYLTYSLLRYLTYICTHTFFFVKLQKLPHSKLVNWKLQNKLMSSISYHPTMLPSLYKSFLPKSFRCTRFWNSRCVNSSLRSCGWISAICCSLRLSRIGVKSVDIAMWSLPFTIIALW